MATFMEQIAYAERWVEAGGPGEQAPPDGSGGGILPGKSKLTESPRAHRQALLTSIVEAEILPRLARLRQSMPLARDIEALSAKAGGGGRVLGGDGGAPAVDVGERGPAVAGNGGGPAVDFGDSGPAVAGNGGGPAFAGDAGALAVAVDDGGLAVAVDDGGPARPGNDGGPALAGADGGLARARDAGAPMRTTDEDTRHLVHLLLTEEASGAMAFISVLRQRGITPAAICLGVVTDAARRLGAMWDEDLCDFVQVSISMGRLQQVLRGLSPLFESGFSRRSQVESLLLAPAPGEQHTFGLMMLAEFFRLEGWQVAGGPLTSAADAIAIVRASWVDVAGFSVGSTGRLEALAHSITAVRRASRNPNLYVMVGGPLILSKPDLVLRLGADITASDAASAIRQARRLLAERMAAD